MSENLFTSVYLPVIWFNGSSARWHKPAALIIWIEDGSQLRIDPYKSLDTDLDKGAEPESLQKLDQLHSRHDQVDDQYIKISSLR